MLEDVNGKRAIETKYKGVFFFQLANVIINNKAQIWEMMVKCL